MGISSSSCVLFLQHATGKRCRNRSLAEVRQRCCNISTSEKPVRRKLHHPVAKSQENRGERLLLHCKVLLLRWQVGALVVWS